MDKVLDLLYYHTLCDKRSISKTFRNIEADIMSGKTDSLDNLDHCVQDFVRMHINTNNLI